MHAQRCLRDIFAIEGFWKSCPELQRSPIFHPFGGTVWFFHFPHSRSFFLFSSPGSSPFLHDGYSSTSSNGRIFVLKQVRRKGKGKRVLFFLFFFFFFLFLSFDWSKFSDETTYSSRSNLFLFYSFPRVTMQLRILCHGRWTRMDGWTVDGMRFLVTRFLFRFNWSIVPRWIQPGN